MFEDMVVRSRFFDYTVTFSDEVGRDLLEETRDGDILVVDATVVANHSERLGSVLAERAVIELEASERAKSFDAVGRVLETVIRTGFRRGDRLVAVGGGVTQDVVAFMATTIYRGVDWVFVPTTLLAQGDSCIGGKSSINFQGWKNLLGSFLPPRRIYIDIAFLESLPEQELTSGLGEILHFLVYSSVQDFEFLERRVGAIRNSANDLAELARRSLSIKKAVIERDELDQGERQLFNYGHSFGHAIEAVTDYGIPHGIAVSMGVDIANWVSVGLGHAPPEFRERVRRTTESLWPGYSIREIDRAAFFDALRRDKKNIGGDVYVILARDFGDLFKTKIDLDGRAGVLLNEYFDSEAS